MTEVLGRIRTADGYTFFHLADDSIVDSLDPASVDMSWASLRQFAQANGDDGTATMDWTVLWTYMTAQEEQCRYAYDKEQHDNERQMGEHEEV